MNARSFIEPTFRHSLAAAGLARFEDFWSLDWNWVEPPNERRHGWSGATRLRLEAPDRLSLFVKRQENHCYRSWRHPLRGQPTFYREWRNIHRLSQAGVPTLEPVFYGERIEAGRYQAVLVTVALDEYVDLDALYRDRDRLDDPASILQSVAMVFRRLHAAGYGHNCMAGKHVMVKRAGGETRVRLLDLEKLKPTHRYTAAAARDLARLMRYTPTLVAGDRRALLDAYCAALSPQEAKALCDAIAAELGRKDRSAIRAGMAVEHPAS